MGGGAAALRLGTRGSALALAQARLVAGALGGAELVPIRTSGDATGVDATGVRPRADRSDERDATGVRPRAATGVRPRAEDKARFVREIEQALLAGEVDLAVHSAKDLPSELPDGLEIAGVPAREDPRDAFVGPAGSLAEVPEGARIGTSSLRRRSQLLAARPDLVPADVRGNVDTRLDKLEAGEFDGLVLAAAGLRRLGREDAIAFCFEHDELTPAPGQGSLAIESRLGDPARARAQAVGDPRAAASLACERAAVAALEASCYTPLGVHAEIEGDADRMRARGFVGLPDGSEWIRDELEGGADQPEALGRELASRMRGAGAEELLARAERMAGAGV